MIWDFYTVVELHIDYYSGDWEIQMFFKSVSLWKPCGGDIVNNVENFDDQNMEYYFDVFCLFIYLVMKLTNELQGSFQK